MELLRLKCFIFVLQFACPVEGSVRTDTWMKPEHLQGMLPSQMIRNITTLTTRSLIGCLDACLFDNSCVSAFYDRVSTTNNCFLHDHVRTNTRLMSSNTDGVYYVRNIDYPPCFIGDYQTTYNTVKLSDGTLLTYRMSDDCKLTYADAVDRCKNESASLVHIQTTAVHDWLATQLDICVDPSRTWIDSSNKNALDFYDVTQWISSDGLGFNPGFWEVTEPENSDTKHCALAKKEWSVKSEDCTNDLEFMCEM